MRHLFDDLSGVFIHLLQDPAVVQRDDAVQGAPEPDDEVPDLFWGERPDILLSQITEHPGSDIHELERRLLLEMRHRFDACADMVRRLWADMVMGHAGKSKHPKSALQEWAAGNRRKVPEYRLLKRSGPDHAARFTVAVSVNGVGEAEATGSSMRDAETLAAEAFMRLFIYLWRVLCFHR